MWRRSASFILDRGNDVAAPHKPESLALSRPPTNPSSSMADTLQNPNPKVSAYYQTRAAHHGVVTSDWLAQAQAAAGPHAPEGGDRSSSAAGSGGGGPFSVIDEFNNWRQQPDLAEAVAAIRALAAVIRASEATTMMELEIELKKASDSLKPNGKEQRRVDKPVKMPRRAQKLWKSESRVGYSVSCHFKEVF